MRARALVVVLTLGIVAYESRNIPYAFAMCTFMLGVVVGVIKVETIGRREIRLIIRDQTAAGPTLPRRTFTIENDEWKRRNSPDSEQIETEPLLETNAHRSIV
jgi:hypothetical protein